MSRNYREELREISIDPERFDRMVKLFSGCSTMEELERACLLYIFDLSYDWGDILNAVKCIQMEKGFKSSSEKEIISDRETR